MRLSNHASNNILQYQTPLLAALWLDSENLEFIMWQNRNSLGLQSSVYISLVFGMRHLLHGITRFLCFDILRIQRVISLTKLKTRDPNHIYMFTCCSNPTILINYWLTNGPWIGLPREAPCCWKKKLLHAPWFHEGHYVIQIFWI